MIDAEVIDAGVIGAAVIHAEDAANTLGVRRRQSDHPGETDRVSCRIDAEPVRA